MNLEREAVFTERIAVVRGIRNHGRIKIRDRIQHRAQRGIHLLDKLAVIAAVAKPVAGREIFRLAALVLVDELSLLGRLAREIGHTRSWRFHAGAHGIAAKRLGQFVDVVRIEERDPGEPRAGLCANP